MFIDMHFSSPLGNLRDLRKRDEEDDVDDVCVCVCVFVKKWIQLSQYMVRCWMCGHYNEDRLVQRHRISLSAT